MHITGGLGAVHGIEGFGANYQLPNKHAYLETCAGVGNVFFNMRMFLKHKDGKYLDVAEIALLNNCLSGLGSDGKSFFYPNPLAADSGHRPRSGWFGTACCPSNIARLIPQVSGYMYAKDRDNLYVNLYAMNQTKVRLKGTDIELRMKTNYPWEENISLSVSPSRATRFGIKLRIPTWTGHKLIPGELYRYSNPTSQPPVIAINGKQVPYQIEKGFASFDRTWSPGDQVTVRFPMPVRKNLCHPKVKANIDRIAVSRGPIVYCAEGYDNDGSVERLFIGPRHLKEKPSVSKFENGPLKRLVKITLPAGVIRKKSVVGHQLVMIPYFSWSNRDRSSMVTWLPTDPRLAKPDPDSLDNRKFSSITASHTFSGDTPLAIGRLVQPKSSFDKTIRRWTSWPQKGKKQWVEIRLKQKRSIESLGVYFYDDRGGVQIPKKWWIEVPVQDRMERLEIYNTDQYSCLKDDYNTIHPAKKLITDRFRIVMIPQHDQTCVGILSVNANYREPKKQETAHPIRPNRIQPNRALPYPERTIKKTVNANQRKNLAMLLPYFLGNGETGVYMTYSNDGLKFQWLAGGNPVMKAPNWPGENLTRDPSIVFHNNKFHMVWTTCWNTRSIGYACSKDLKKWSKPLKIDVWNGRKDIKNTWAPELHWDPEKEEYFILFSSTTQEELHDKDGTGNPHGYDHRCYAVRTKDFQSFSEPKLFYTTKNPELSIIDPYITKDDRSTETPNDDRWVMVIKNEMPAGKGGKNLRLVFSEKMQGPYQTTLGPPIVGSGTEIVDRMGEGPSMLKIGQEYWLYWDAPGSKYSYCLATSKDLVTWKNRSAELSLPVKHMRHGTVLRIPNQTLKKIQSALDKK